MEPVLAIIYPITAIAIIVYLYKYEKRIAKLKKEKFEAEFSLEQIKKRFQEVIAEFHNTKSVSIESLNLKINKSIECLNYIQPILEKAWLDSNVRNSIERTRSMLEE